MTKRMALSLLLLYSLPAWGGFSHVRDCTTDKNDAAILSCTMGVAPLPGELVTTGLITLADISNVSVKDSDNNSYTITSTSPGNFAGGYLYTAYLLHAPSNAGATITWRWTTSTIAAEFVSVFSASGGKTAFDKSAVTNNGVGSGTSINSPTVTPAGSGELLYSVANVNDHLTSPTGGAKQGVWTGGGLDASTGTASEYDLSASSATAVNYTDQTSGDRYTAIAMAFTFTPGGTPPNPYSTTFPATENPVSENGFWLNGKKDGLDWGDFQTTPGKAFGTLVSNTQPPDYNDNTAALTGTWGAAQTACGAVYIDPSYNRKTTGQSPEVEIRLNVTISKNNINGYEFNYSLRNADHIYAGLARWNGPYGSFQPLTSTLTPPALNNGDTLCLANDGTGLLTATRNGARILQTRDSTFLGGSPGMGHQISGPPTPPTSDLAKFGFSNFTGLSK